ncbi:MAG: hypothetical protein ACLPQY_04165 [Streptosporangiaceae bacterium]
MGQQVQAFIQLAGGVPASQAVADELAALRTRIARFKVRRRFAFVQRLPAHRDRQVGQAPPGL